MGEICETHSLRNRLELAQVTHLQLHLFARLLRTPCRPSLARERPVAFAASRGHWYAAASRPSSCLARSGMRPLEHHVES